jgi:hypothetical protein
MGETGNAGITFNYLISDFRTESTDRFGIGYMPGR